ncbi:four-carbon acid sugar kinase family protein [Lichenibacterium ramalinae]|uniref:Four-carbon acid sugar kinase family protein n=1 Tax=Lichenibacterium ramalinae TaxID=2316527 RepID=A0A4Q2RA22_9HYPH|nr:four-carbon acid sugar kinase family protein [Lichenibacterium ramalinae]RYB01708.1 four-carbon acid sugar kinase family protein [Lichenibacterium ramalinae]
MPDLLLSFYGDDLTGSTDAMEALESRGVPTALFLDIPSPDQLARLGPVSAIGIAGTSRSQSPAWMDVHLTPALRWLHGQGAALCHYKVCSTFDSAPDIGSIGRAIDIGATIFDQATVPLVVGAPQLKRYTAFGTLFAAYRGETFRIDRHPVMSRHPVTPMHEADLRRHLALQTERGCALLDLADLQAEDRDARLAAALADAPGVLLIDVADPGSQRAAGDILWTGRRGRRFVVGSSGVEYALSPAWTEAGIAPGRAAFPDPGAVDRLAVVSGSCSPTTERQIRHALDGGFVGVGLDPRRMVSVPDEVLAEAVAAGSRALAEGRSVILHTALGPASDLGSDIDALPDGRHRLGRGLGRILRALVERHGLRRAVVAGGDTSSHALRELDVFALRTRLPLPQTPGSPLCTAFSDHAAFDGLEVALKGGQVGHDDYFEAIRLGRPHLVD